MQIQDPKVVLPSDTNYKFEGLQDHPQVQNSLEGFTEPIKVIILTVMVDYCAKTQIKIREGKKFIGQVQELTQHGASSGRLPVESGE